MTRIIIIFFALTISIWYASAQSLMMKTDLMYAAVTSTPNLGAEMRLGDKSTLDIKGAYHPWNLQGTADNNRKLVHWKAQVEYRYWPCRNFDGHFFGVHVLASQYNVGQRNLDFMLGVGSEKYRFQGYGLGAGISYGYQWLLGKNWSLEANAGFGAAFLNHDKYEFRKCGEQKDSERLTYWGPTVLGINLVYFIH